MSLIPQANLMTPDGPLYPFNKRVLATLRQLQPSFLRASVCWPGASSCSSEGSSSNNGDSCRCGVVILGKDLFQAWLPMLPARMPLGAAPAMFRPMMCLFRQTHVFVRMHDVTCRPGGAGIHEALWLAEELGAEAIWSIPLPLEQETREQQQHAESESKGNDDAGKGGAAAAAAKDGGGEGAGGLLLYQEGALQEVLAGLEFVLGEESSRWGGLRAHMGRKEPWQLQYVGLGDKQSCAHPLFSKLYQAYAEVRASNGS